MNWNSPEVAESELLLDGTIVNVALPHIQNALGFSDSNLEWVVNVYALVFGGLLLLGGRSGDLLGRRRIFITGILVFAGASLLGGFATDQAWLLAARALQGVGGAMAAPTALSLIAVTFPEGPPRNRAMGVYASMSVAGAAAGLIAGGLLVNYLNWRWVFFVNVPIGLVVAALATRVLPESQRRTGRFDLPGAITGTLGVASLVYGLSSAATSQNGVSHWGDTKVIASLTAAAVLLAAFAVIEVRSTHALLPIRVLRSRDRTGSYLISLCVGAALFGMFFFLTIFVQNVWGYSPLKTGIAFLPITAMIILASGIASQAVPRIGARPLMIAGSAEHGRRDVLAIPDHRAQQLRRRPARPDADHRARPGDRVLARLPGLRGDQPAGADHRAGRDPRHPPGPVRREPAGGARRLSALSARGVTDVSSPPDAPKPDRRPEPGRPR